MNRRDVSDLVWTKTQGPPRRVRGVSQPRHERGCEKIDRSIPADSIHIAQSVTLPARAREPRASYSHEPVSRAGVTDCGTDRQCFSYSAPPLLCSQPDLPPTTGIATTLKKCGTGIIFWHLHVSTRTTLFCIFSTPSSACRCPICGPLHSLRPPPSSKILLQARDPLRRLGQDFEYVR